MQPRKPNTILIISLIIIVIAILLAGFWYFFIRTPSVNTGGTSTPTTGFSPFGGGTVNQGTTTTNNGNPNTTYPTEVTIPTLRLLSATPIGGYGASTTASTTVVRWVDRGRGNILEAREDSLDINTLSNTLLPRVYSSIWNQAITSFIGTVLGDDESTVSTVYATLVPQASSTTLTPYELRGKSLPTGIVASASSPKKDKVFFFIVKNGQGIGYTAPLSGGVATQIFTTPMTQVNVEWPEENTIAITTKGSITTSGYLYFVNPKTGIWKKILGPMNGLSTTVSHDAKYVLVSATGNAKNVVTFIYSVDKAVINDAIIQTLADKCTWGNFYKNIVYCAVPFQPVSGIYPDDWYEGTLSTVDKIWQVNADTSEVHLLSSVFSEAKKNIDAYNLGLDSKDNYLFFMNKNDLSFWSLDLVNTK